MKKNAVAFGLTLLACLIFSTPATSADKEDKERIYKPMGGPANPKVPVAWNRYYNYSEISGILKKLADKHASRARLQSVGKSFGKREMWVLTLGSFEKGNSPLKISISKMYCAQIIACLSKIITQSNSTRQESNCFLIFPALKKRIYQVI